MTERNRKWSLVCFVLLLAIDGSICFWVGGDHASTLFLVLLFLGIVGIGKLFLTSEDTEISPLDDNNDIS